ncbi:uncharacterized protein [Rutidosis leptorrhynchoides]|uniref:uncharacterized protein n=1 Tax=Rutidosis leptorrhynchoides TaxID=125765 RepID=UPI003A99D037
MKILKCFENVAGLKVNLHKSLIFGLGVINDEVDNMAHRVGCKVGEFHFTYLGIPIGKNMNKVENWNPVVEKFNLKLADWKARSVSYGGRLTLVKSVLSYSIETLGLHFANSFLKVIGDGASTRFWEDPWLCELSLKDKFRRLSYFEVDRAVLVRDRIQWLDGSITMTWGWNRDLNGLAQDDLNALIILLNSYVKQDKPTDSWSWNMAANGIYTIKKMSGYIDDITIGNNTAHQNETLKNNLVPKKVEVFIWRVLKRRIPVRTELDKRGIDIDSVRCPLCDDDIETIDHLMFFVVI